MLKTILGRFSLRRFTPNLGCFSANSSLFSPHAITVALINNVFSSSLSSLPYTTVRINIRPDHRTKFVVIQRLCRIFGKIIPFHNKRANHLIDHVPVLSNTSLEILQPKQIRPRLWTHKNTEKQTLSATASSAA